MDNISYSVIFILEYLSLYTNIYIIFYLYKYTICWHVCGCLRILCIYVLKYMRLSPWNSLISLLLPQASCFDLALCWQVYRSAMWSHPPDSLLGNILLSFSFWLFLFLGTALLDQSAFPSLLEILKSTVFYFCFLIQNSSSSLSLKWRKFIVSEMHCTLIKLKKSNDRLDSDRHWCQ